MENSSEVEPELQTSLTGWFPKRNQPEDLPAYSVLQDNKSYLADRIPRLEKKITSELHRIIHSGRRSDGVGQQSQNEKQDLLSQLSSMPLEVLLAYVDSETRRLEGAESDLRQKRSKGLNKAGAKVQEFAVVFDRFLKAYSGIVDIVAVADAQYGGVACATLSLLFATVKLKAEDEKSIQSAMRQISDRIPDFKVYQRIYPDPSLGLMLAVAYRDVILLAREAASYFQTSGFKRYTRSVGRPLQFQLMEQNTRDNFSRIRLKCETLLAERVDQLVKQNKEMQEREDIRIIIEMRNILSLGDYRPEEMRKSLQEYRKILARYFDSDRHRQKMGLSDFLATSFGQDWESKGSLLLVLCGRNEVGVSTVSHSWLSPVAIDLAQSLLDSNCTIAYENCTESSTLVEVLSRLIFQLLEMRPALVRRGDDLHNIESQLSYKGEDKVTAFYKALLTIINLQNDRVFIILNRPDVCEEESSAEYIEIMLSLVEKAKVELKIMLVQRTEISDIGNKWTSSATQRSSSKKFQIMRLDQNRI